MSSWTNTSIWTTRKANLLDLVSTNFDNLVVNFIQTGMVQTNTFNRPVVIETDLVFHNSRNTLSSTTIVTVRLKTAVYCIKYFEITIALKYTIRCLWILLCIMLWINLFLVVISEKPTTFLGSLPPQDNIYIKIFFFHKRLKKRRCCCNQFSKHPNLIETTVTSGRLAWLKSLDDDLKT
jgi:hypothetical protein